MVKMSMLPKASFGFNAIPIKILTQFFIELERAICKFIWNNKKLRTEKLFSTIKGLLGKSPSLKLSYREIVIKTVWYWYRDSQLAQWNTVEDPEMNPHTCDHLIFDKGVKTIRGRGGGRQHFQQMVMVQLAVSM